MKNEITIIRRITIFNGVLMGEDVLATHTVTLYAREEEALLEVRDILQEFFPKSMRDYSVKPEKTANRAIKGEGANLQSARHKVFALRLEFAKGGSDAFSHVLGEFDEMLSCLTTANSSTPFRVRQEPSRDNEWGKTLAQEVVVVPKPKALG